MLINVTSWINMARLSLKNPPQNSPGRHVGNLRILQEDLEQVEYELDSTQQHLGSLQAAGWLFADFFSPYGCWGGCPFRRIAPFFSQSVGWFLALEAIGLPEIDFVGKKQDACSSTWETLERFLLRGMVFLFFFTTSKLQMIPDCVLEISPSQTLLHYGCFRAKKPTPPHPPTAQRVSDDLGGQCRLDFAEWCLSHPEYKDMVGSAMFLAESQAVANAMRPWSGG